MNDLYTNTLNLARELRLSPSIVSREAKVGLRWYHKFLNEDWKDPGVKRVQRLHDYLQGKAEEHKAA